MREARIPAILALLGLQALGVHANITCYNPNSTRDSPEVKIGSLIDSLENPITELCHNQQAGTYNIQEGNRVYEVERSRPGDRNICVKSLSQIITRCIETEKAEGGLVINVQDGTSYKITSIEVDSMGLDTTGAMSDEPSSLQTRDEPDLLVLEAREPRGSRGGSKARRPARKAKPKPTKKKSTKKKSTKKKSTKKKSTKKKSTKKKSTKKKSTKKKSTKKKSTKKKATDCKKLYAKMMARLRKTEPVRRWDTGLLARNENSEAIVQLEKRYSPKPGKACGIDFDAHPYPEKKQMKAAKKKELWFGYQRPDVCTNYVFRAANGPATGIAQRDYHLEHVLEWQVVTSFFDWIQKVKTPGAVFDNPDPTATAKKVDFCDYWKMTWIPTKGKDDLKTLTIGSVGADESADARLPLDHIKDAFPGRRPGKTARKGVNAFFEDFVYLHGLINTPSKANMWADKSDPNAGVFSDRTAACTSQNINTGKDTIMDLRNLLGARKYMAHKTVAGILKRQKVRMGKTLQELDVAMTTHAKQGFTAWQAQDLGRLWDEYMDEKFEAAKQRTERDMNTYLGLLVTTWRSATTPQEREVYADLMVLKKEWAREKMKPWMKPW